MNDFSKTLIDAGFDVSLGLSYVGDMQLLEELVDVFIDELAYNLYMIEDYVKLQEYKEAARLVHSTKGSSATLGHPKIYELSARYLDKLRNHCNDVEEINDLTEKYVNYCNDVIKIVKKTKKG